MTSSRLAGMRVGFVGKFGSVTKREAMQLVREHGGVSLERLGGEVDLLVMGVEQSPRVDPLELLDERIRDRVRAGEVKLITETELLEQLGIAEASGQDRCGYTPAMLADLLGIPVRNLRRWQEEGMIVPYRVVHRLPYFDFSQVQTARQIATWLEAGASFRSVRHLFAELNRRYSNPADRLAHAHVIVEGKQLLVRYDTSLEEPSGQLRIDFDSLEDTFREGSDPPILRPFALLEGHNGELTLPNISLEELEQYAKDAEDSGNLTEAIGWYRILLARSGPQPGLHFQLAELLYREGEVLAARERYYNAIELDEDFVEARANLGCVLAETGQTELAVAAFQGALVRHDDYPDVHFHLARALDDLQRGNEARDHWKRFLELAPSSPWSDEARARLQE